MLVSMYLFRVHDNNIIIISGRIEEIGLTHIKSIVKELGGWPVLEGESWDVAKFDWIPTTYKFKDMGLSIDYLIDFSITTDVKNSTRRIIDVSFIFL